MPSSIISRRNLLLAPAALLGCGPKKATGFAGYCFTANRDGRGVGVVDLSTFRLVKQIPLDAAPAAILAHPREPKVLVLAPDAGTVYEIDARTLSVSRRVRAGSAAAGMQISPSQDALWVLYHDPAALVELPLDSLRPRRRIRLSAPADAFDLSQQNQAALARWKDRTIIIASLEHAAVERTIDAGCEPSLVRFRLDGKQVMAGSRPDRNLSIFDVPTGKTVVRLPLPLEPRNFCSNADGWLFITGGGMDAVVIAFPYSTEIWQTVLAGRAPGAMAVTEASSALPSLLMVSNPETNSVTVLDVITENLLALVQVGERPGRILTTPDHQYALVLNEKSGDMAVIRMDRLGGTSSKWVRRYKSAPIFTMIPVGERPVDAAVVQV